MADQNSPDPLTTVDNDMPISEVVTVLKNTPPPETPTLTEVNTGTSATPPEAPVVKSPLFEDPDEIVVKRTL